MDRSTALLGRALNGLAVPAPRLAGRAALRIFLSPGPRSRVRPAERDVHDRAETSALTVGGRRTAVYRWGDGSRPVLLVHGWQSRASRFAPYVPRLRALGLSPIAFDAPGHGDSAGRSTTILEYREVIGRLAERYGPFEGIVAHSFGVPCAVLALRDGVPAGRLAAIAGVAEFDLFATGFRARLGLGAGVERDLVRRLREVLGLDGPGWGRYDATADPAAVDLPVLVVHDEDDRVVPIAQAHRLEAAYGDRLRLVTTRGLGHRRVLTDPAVVDDVVGFLAGQPVARPAGAPA